MWQMCLTEMDYKEMVLARVVYLQVRLFWFSSWTTIVSQPYWVNDINCFSFQGVWGYSGRCGSCAPLNFCSREEEEESAQPGASRGLIE
jgi:hypothetical protein